MGSDDDSRSFSPVGWTNPRLIVWWGSLFRDDAFASRYAARWRQIRASNMKLENLHALIDSMTAEIEEASVRNYTRWPDLVDLPIAVGFQKEVDQLKN